MAKLRNFPKIRKNVERRALVFTSAKIIQFLKARLNRGKPLQSRSGRYVRSIKSDRIRTRSGSTEKRISAKNLPYGRAHEEGRRAIRSTKGQAMAVPLPSVLNKKGQSKFKSPLRESLAAAFGVKNVFIHTSKSGKKFIARRQGQKLTLLYILKRSIKLKRRPLWGPVARRFRFQLATDVQRGLRAAMRRL